MQAYDESPRVEPTLDPALIRLGIHRVIEPVGALPQAAYRLDPTGVLRPDEVAVEVERLNLDAASFRQLSEKHHGDGDAVRAEVLAIIGERGKMHNPATGSGGMLLGRVAEVGPDSPLGLAVGDRIATLVSLTLTPLLVTDDLEHWDGRSEQVPCSGRAILFGRSIAARLPVDLAAETALSVFDVCGAPALTDRVVRSTAATRVCVIGGAGKSGSLSLAAARRAGASTIAVVGDDHEAALVRAHDLAHVAVVADARDPLAVAAAVSTVGGPAEVTVVCVDVAGCEGGAILATAPGGTVIFFSMATQFAAAALGAEGLAADVTMIIGNGYVPGHAAFALEAFGSSAGVQRLFAARTQTSGHVVGDRA